MHDNPFASCLENGTLLGQIPVLSETVNLLRSFQDSKSHGNNTNKDGDTFHNNKINNNSGPLKEVTAITNLLPNSLMRNFRGQRCLAIGTIVVQIFTVCAVGLTLVRNWGVIEAFFAGGKPTSHVGKIINRIFQQDEINMLADENFAMRFLCHTYDKGNGRTAKVKFNRLSVTKQAVVLSCSNIKSDQFDFLTSGAGFLGYQGEKRREDIMIWKTDLIGKFTGYNGYTIDENGGFMFIERNNTATVGGMLTKLMDIVNIASRPMFVRLKSMKSETSFSYRSVIAGLKTLSKIKLRIDNILLRLANETSLHVPRSDWLSRCSQKRGICLWIHSRWMELESDTDIDGRLDLIVP